MARAGQFRERVSFQTPGSTQNTAGETIETWTARGSTVANSSDTVWARVEPMSGREIFDADRDLGIRPFTITTRFSTTIDAYNEKDRVVWRGTNHNIETKAHREARRREIEFMTTVTT